MMTAQRCRGATGWGRALSCLVLLSGPVNAEALLGVHTENITALRGEPDRRGQLGESGARVIRLPVTWHLMEESAAGRTPDWFWAELDAEVAAAEALGAGLILTFAQTPCWASSDPARQCGGDAPSWDLLYPPRDPADYAAAAGRLAARYRGRILAYEIWNEPNLVWFLHGAPPRATGNDEYGSFIDLAAAETYAALVTAAYPAIKAEDPEVTVLAGSLAGGDLDYLRALHRVPGFARSYDALSMHPYTAEFPGDSADGARFGPGDCPDGAPEIWCAARSVEAVHGALAGLGRPDADIWFTEFGFSSSRYWNGSSRAAGAQGDAEVGQAVYLADMLRLIEGWSFVPVACWYELRDTAPHDRIAGEGFETEREAHYGLFRADPGGEIKPAGRVFQAATARH